MQNNMSIENSSEIVNLQESLEGKMIQFPVNDPELELLDEIEEE